MKIQPEKELLELLGKTEQEQYKWLADSRVIKTGGPSRYGPLIDESLADLAERLWEKARKTEGADLLQALCDVAGVMEKRKKCDQCGHESFAGVTFFWATDADATHRIVAALLALKRNGVEL